MSRFSRIQPGSLAGFTDKRKAATARKKSYKNNKIGKVYKNKDGSFSYYIPDKT